MRRRHHLALAGIVETAQEVEKRRLAGARWPSNTVTSPLSTSSEVGCSARVFTASPSTSCSLKVRDHHGVSSTAESSEAIALLARLPMGPTFPNLPLRLRPVLNRSTVLAALLLVELIGALGDLRRQIGRCLGQRLALAGSKIRYASSFTRSFTRNHSQRIAPDEHCPAPAERRHEQPIDRDQRRHDLRAEHGHP